MADRHNSVREGILSGLLGATAIAVWFAIVDIVSGKPFYTPDLLGRGLTSILGKPPTMPDTMAMHVLGYTLFHYVAFALLGIVVAWLVHKSATTPAVLAGFLVVFVMIEAGAYMAAGLLTESPFGALAWYQILIANLLAVSLMGWFMWSRHPDLKRDLNAALKGEDA